MAMKLGVCAGIHQADTLRQAGYDFIECPVVSLEPEKPEAEVRSMLQQYIESPLPVEVCNMFLPGDLHVVGEKVNEERIRSYVEKALTRVKQIGADTVVFGSGRARMVPDRFDRSKAEHQLLQFLNIAADYADPLGVTIAIEPLNKLECNIINSVPEAVHYAQQVNRKSIRVLADFYHMEMEKEPLSNLVAAKKYLAHVHVADSERLAPGTGQYPYDAFAALLREAGYRGRISIECGRWNQFEQEVEASQKYLAQFFA